MSILIFACRRFRLHKLKLFVAAHDQPLSVACASPIQIVCPSTSRAETQRKLKPAFFRLSAMVSQYFTMPIRYYFVRQAVSASPLASPVLEPTFANPVTHAALVPPNSLFFAVSLSLSLSLSLHSEWGSGGGVVLPCGISICSLQLGQFTALAAPLCSTERCSPQRGQLKRMSALRSTGLVTVADSSPLPTVLTGVVQITGGNSS